MDWQEEAAKAIAEGYQPGNEWEQMLTRQLKRCRKKLVKEFGADFAAYTQVMTHRAQQQLATMIAQGTDPEVARELARDELLQSGMSS